MGSPGERKGGWWRGDRDARSVASRWNRAAGAPGARGSGVWAHSPAAALGSGGRWLALTRAGGCKMVVGL